jgi:hypothetical protein
MWVLVNGRAVVADGRITTERPGRVLRGPGAPRRVVTRDAAGLFDAQR